MIEQTSKGEQKVKGKASMKGFVFVVAALTASFVAAPARAAIYDLSATGTVTGAQLAINSAFTPAPTGKFKVGDAFNLKMRFDADKAILTSLYDADPTINIYWLPDMLTTITSGTYTSSYKARFDISSSVQFWNDHNVVGKTDSQSFRSSNYDFNGPTPYDLGGGLNFETVGLNAFDWSALLRSSDMISQLNGTSAAFNSNSMQYTYSTGAVPGSNAVRPVVLVDIGNVSWSLNPVSAVPEPSTWAMMIIGFGAIGFAKRRQRKVVTGLTYAS
ncbi:PEPxxWA-CTERM sorting domain-containing protein [Novosphingobium chloroacetimidivorans]|uniref:PEPxxWA-CTERM sorting domain-containing protein n=1 Tax=Novosphingobium chloroacetimidivorans TaxID=1428314 RepID=UPI001FE56118|nr:PEPxxWA-CTERM sorting domain-containing protein [Novosphingobium chloroacetimidivorans]